MKYKNQLICGDVLAVLPKIRKGVFSLVFGSPPYQDARVLRDDPFAVLKGMEWIDWMVQVYLASLRACTGLVAFVVQGRTKNYSYFPAPGLLQSHLYRLGYCLRDSLIYHRVGVPGSGGPDWLRHDCEYVVCATNGGKLSWSNNTAMGHPPRWAPGGAMSHRIANGSRVNQWGKQCGLNGEVAGGWTERQRNGTRRPTPTKPSHRVAQKYNGVTKANPGNLVQCIVGGGRMGSTYAHENEAPFPEKLAEWMIRTFAKPGSCVLDPFCGSGTTCAVAKKLGRAYCGIDIRQSQIDLTKRRLAEI